MRYDCKPLYPPVRNDCGCGDWTGRESWRMPLFQCESHRPGCECGCGQRVRLENPCCPGEVAEIHLSVDHCGNLVICVHKDAPGCGCHPRPKKRC